MKTRILLFSVLLFCGFKLIAQTENYDPDGTYWGPSFKSINIDFTKAEIGALPDPVVTEDIQEYAFLGLNRFTIRTRPVVGQEGVSVVTLFNHNPTIDGNNNTKSSAMIYFPTLEDGAGAIRLDAWLGSTVSSVSRAVFLNYFDNESNAWRYIKSLTIPGDGSGVEAEIGMEGEVRLSLAYKSGEYLSIKGITISSYGEGLPTSVNTELIEKISLQNDVLHLNSEVADVFFYTFSGQQILVEKNVSGEVQLPSNPGIVKVVGNNGSAVLKKI